MESLPDDLRQKIPGLYCTRHEADPTVWIKFVSPSLNWRWYIIECEQVESTTIFYGWMLSSDEKYGRFIRSDLTSMQAYFGITIEREEQFVPCHLSQVKAQEENEREVPPRASGSNPRRTRSS
jgi:hypothetical protein